MARLVYRSGYEWRPVKVRAIISLIERAGCRAERAVSSMRYAIVIEAACSNYSAYVPDLPGCIATGATLAEVEREIRAAIWFHLEGLAEHGTAPPTAQSIVDYVEA